MQPNTQELLTTRTRALRKVISKCRKIINLEDCPDDSQIELCMELLRQIYKELHMKKTK